MESVFEAFISNPALYSAGHLVGETLHFPTNTEEVQSLLKRIGVDGVRCQEYFIISFDSDILGLYDYLSEYENIDELNHLAHLLKELSPSERETLEAVMDSGQHCGSVQDLINLTQNLDCYDFHPGVDNEEMLGRLYVEDMESLEVPDNIKPYFDFEAYGRDISINENGHFAPGGYVTKVSDDFREVYHGPQDTFPLNTGFLLTPCFRSGSRWPLIKKLLTVPQRRGSGGWLKNTMRNGNWTSRQFVPRRKEAV